MEIIATGQTAQYMLSTLSAIYNKTQILRAEGSLRQALQLCQEELELITLRGWNNFPAAGFLYVAFGDLLRERNELILAQEYLEKGISMGQEGGNPYILIAGHVWLAWLRQTQGDVIGGHKAIQTALQLIQHHHVSRFWPLPSAACYQARLWIAQGNLTEAGNWAQADELNPANPPVAFVYEVECLTLTRLLIAQGNLVSAESLLIRLHRAAALAGRGGSLIEILVLQTITFAAQKRNEKALSALAQALSLAEPEGFMRIFLDEGEPMRDVIRMWGLKNDRQKKPTELQKRLITYADKLLDAFSKNAAPLPVTNEQVNSPVLQAPLVDPLTARELEVLQLIAEGLSNLAIAQKLYLSAGTVKVHLKHIYGKLDVNSRTQAVARLRELNL
jgi:LuxR family maltose regulon positive regulatory protein